MGTRGVADPCVRASRRPNRARHAESDEGAASRRAERGAVQTASGDNGAHWA